MAFSNEEDPREDMISRLRQTQRDVFEHKLILADLQNKGNRFDREIRSLSANVHQMNYERTEKLPEINLLKQQKKRSEKKIEDLKTLQIIQKMLGAPSCDAEQILQQKLSLDTMAKIVALLKR